MGGADARLLRRKFLLSTTMLVGALAGYGRRAYGACVNSGGSTYTCSGANATAQTINANDAAVSTVAGFSVTTLFGNAITITGDGALSYTDTNASPLISPATGLYVQSNGNIPAGNLGGITINTNGAVLGSTGISAFNYGGGAVRITANGDVTGVLGITAQNYGTDLGVTTGPVRRSSVPCSASVPSTTAPVQQP